MSCINPKCSMADWGHDPEVEYLPDGSCRVACKCGCAGPSVGTAWAIQECVFQGHESESVPFVVFRRVMEARALELWQDLIRRMEPGIALGEAAKELRERREGVA